MRKSALLLTSAVLVLITLIAGCPSDQPSAISASPDASAAQAAPAPTPGPTPPASERRGRPLPAFDGAALDGSPLSIAKFLGKRTLLFGFNPELPNARVVADALAIVARDRSAANFQIAGFSMGSTPETTAAFLKDIGVDFTTFSDPSGDFIKKYAGPSPLWMLLADADGNVIQATDYFPTDLPEPGKAVERMLREWLRLAPAGELPLAPDFMATRMGGGAPFKLSALRGKPLVLVFFLHTCPHCHDALGFLKDEFAKLGDAAPALVGISVSASEYAVKEELDRAGLGFFQVVFDEDGSIRNKYGATLGVPVVLLIDAQGRITARTQGWRVERDPPLTRMRLATLVGKEPPMLLSQSGYSGNDFCAACHASEAATWELTQHATALNTLVKYGADGRSECVTCHVVGYGQPGGFTIARGEPSLENVGCETCHGRGGPHLSPGHVAGNDYEKVCATCHTPEHSLGFKYAKFLPRVSHAELAILSPTEKQAFLAARGKPRTDLLPENVASVGSEACASCHASEYAKWQAHPHAKASPEVGCETCHGGGADHVAAGALKKGTITSLADKCGSCAITQLCGSCHTEEKEPGFGFDIRAKIEHQRHSDKPLQGLVSREPPPSAVAALLERERAFAAPPAGGR